MTWFFSARCVELWRIGDPLSCMTPADMFVATGLVIVGALLLTKIMWK